jgi:PadR family transcriptional regulator PadR
MPEKPDVLQGTLALMVVKTLDLFGPLHGQGIARRIGQISLGRTLRISSIGLGR